MARIDKINNEIKRALSTVIQEEVDDPRIGLISIVSVNATADLKYCKVFFSVFPESSTDDAYYALSGMKDFIRKVLGAKLRLKYLPELEFLPDDSIKYSIEINKRIDEINKDTTE